MKYMAILAGCVLITSSSQGQEYKFKKSRKRIYVSDSTGNYGNLRLKNKKTKHFDAYIGASVMKPPANKKMNNNNDEGLVTLAASIGADIFLSNSFSLGGYVSTFSYGQEGNFGGRYYMLKPATIFGIKTQKQIHAKYFEIPFNLSVGYLKSQGGNWAYTNKTFPNTYTHVKGVESKVGLAIRKQFLKMFYVEGGLNYNIIYGEGEASRYYMGLRSFYAADYPFQSNYFSISMLLGFCY